MRSSSSDETMELPLVIDQSSACPFQLFRFRLLQPRPHVRHKPDEPGGSSYAQPGLPGRQTSPSGRSVLCLRTLASSWSCSAEYAAQVAATLGRHSEQQHLDAYISVIIVGTYPCYRAC